MLRTHRNMSERRFNLRKTALRVGIVGAWVFALGTLATLAPTIDETYEYSSGTAGYSWALDAYDADGDVVPDSLADYTVNDTADAWCESTTAIGSSGDYGTPGVVNEVCEDDPDDPAQ